MGAFMINDRLFDNLEIVDSYKKLKLKARKRTVGFSLTGDIIECYIRYITGNIKDNDETDIMPEKLAYTLYDVSAVFACGREKALKIMHC